MELRFCYPTKKDFPSFPFWEFSGILNYNADIILNFISDTSISFLIFFLFSGDWVTLENKFSGEIMALSKLLPRIFQEISFTYTQLMYSILLSLL